MPAGWLSRRSRKGKVAKTEHQQHGEFAGHDESPGIVTLARYSAPEFRLAEATAWLAFLFGGDFTGFAGWIKERASVQNHPFEAAVREADLQFVCSTVKGGTRI
jgi:hypothetical protein